MDPSTPDVEAALRRLPAVDHLLQQPAFATLLDEYPRGEVVTCIRAALDALRARLRGGGEERVETSRIALDVRRLLYERGQPSLRRVVNATGVVLHTGLGRAPLAAEAVEAIADVARGYSNLEYDLESGARGDRHAHVAALLAELTGAEDALVVNNNAAGTFLALQTLAGGAGVVVSRGQLVEIGGSYRMPDVMAAAGCRMIEVGTTNRTHLRDYERAIDADTRVLLRVHTSNYRVQGFATAPPVAALVDLARRRGGLQVIDDLGSGLLDAAAGEPEAGAGERPAAFRIAGADVLEEAEAPQRAGGGAWDEPSVRDSLRAGADVVLFSGDKLLGGPQAGLICGRRALLERMRANPLVRTFRPDKLTLAALEATLRLWRDPQRARRGIPALRMLHAADAELERRAERLEAALRAQSLDCALAREAGSSYAGGGTLPTVAFATRVVRVSLGEPRVREVARALRDRALPVIARVHQSALLFDCRTIDDEDVDAIAVALREVLEG